MSTADGGCGHAGGVPSSALQGDMPTTPPAAGGGVSVYTATPPQAAKKQLKKTTKPRQEMRRGRTDRNRGMNYPCRFPGCGKPFR